METWTLIIGFGMPAVIFLLALRNLLVRLGLEARGARIAAKIVDVRPASGSEGEAEEALTYRFVVSGNKYTGSVQLAAGRQPRAAGDTIEVLYDVGRPSFNQPVSGPIANSVGCNVALMIAMVATAVWLGSLLTNPH
jgi:hypothetical protein